MSKKERTYRKILDAALIEFGTKGYDLASTNHIYQLAGVSKGTVFLYFKSKAELFYAVYSENIQKVLDEMSSGKFELIEDIFERMLTVTMWKAKYFATRPHETKVLLEAVTDPPNIIKEKMINHLEQLTKLSMNHFFHEIDMSKFSSNYTKDEVIRFIQVALVGVQNTYLKPGMTLESLELIRDESMKFIKTVIIGMEK